AWARFKALVVRKERAKRKAGAGMTFNASRPSLLCLGVIIGMMIGPVEARAQGSSTADPGKPKAQPAAGQGRIMATQLPPHLKRLINAAKRLNEEPGLILDREKIEEVIGARLIESKPTRNTQGGRILVEYFASEGPLAAPLWRGRLVYTDQKESDSWSVRLEFGYAQSIVDPGLMCYFSRLLEAYWGKPFMYTPPDVHAQLQEWTRRPDLPPTGPHDGRSYTAAFRDMHPGSASVFFDIGPGGCLYNISIGNQYKNGEFSDDHIYHE
ncbi:hypothetical protein, partial [Variovorax sp. KK3]